MLLFPEVQTRVAAEMDEIVGHDRMPPLADLPNLPYLKAAWTESLRWRPPVPLCKLTFIIYWISFLMRLTAAFNVAIPHKNTTEDVYNGYRIPKGTIIYSNVACVLVYLVRRIFRTQCDSLPQIYAQRPKCMARAAIVQARTFPQHTGSWPVRPEGCHLWVWASVSPALRPLCVHNDAEPAVGNALDEISPKPMFMASS